MLRELSDPIGFAWIDSESGGVILWNRYTRTFKFATSNDPGIVPVRMEGDPWARGASDLEQARELATLFFNQQEAV